VSIDVVRIAGQPWLVLESFSKGDWRGNLLVLVLTEE